MKKWLVIGALGFLVLLAAGVSLWMDLNTYADAPADTKAATQIFSVRQGDSFSEVTHGLAAGGIIIFPQKFSRFARLKGLDKRIRAGEYELSAAMSPRQVLKVLVEGKIRLHRLTIPEGYNLEQIAAEAAKAGLCSAESFLSEATDPLQVHHLGLEGNSLEGYLFPDTYFFPKDTSPDKMLAAMVSRFWSVFTSQWQRRAEDLGMSIHEVVTLASIIEKETGAADERPLISSVFHNRLKKGMRLESDPTVIYGLESFDGNLTRKHLRTPTAYNTYKIKGLPPGPIASPGKEALLAALYPAQTDYLYFVAKRDGTHYFSSNFQEHDQAVKKYQLRRSNG